MVETKKVWKSRTLWGIAATVLVAIAAPSWEAYRKDKNWEDALSAAFAGAISVLPASYAVYGRMDANTPLDL